MIQVNHLFYPKRPMRDKLFAGKIEPLCHHKLSIRDNSPGELDLHMNKTKSIAGFLLSSVVAGLALAFAVVARRAAV